MLSSVRENDPGAASSVRTNSARPNSKSLAGGNGPLNRPVAGSSVGLGRVLSSTTPRPCMLTVTSAVFWKFEASATGVVALVLRGDSRLDGPDWNELTSNAVTA